MTEAGTVTAAALARAAGIDPKRLRRALRAEAPRWHAHGDRWTVAEGGDEHALMRRVLAGLGGR